jgi:fructokinase
MKDRGFQIVGLGEILWDLFPAGRQLGGAPANFAYISNLLGNRGVVASRIGDDELGKAALEYLAQRGISTDSIQTDSRHATGTVGVEVDSAGQPCFEIAESVAWDYLEWTPAWKQLAGEADAVCFGSLAQRCPTTGATIRRFLQATRPAAVKVFDVNLRQRFFTREILVKSIEAADIVKLNHEELPRILAMLDIAEAEDKSAALQLAERHNLKLVCVTRGSSGSLLATGNQKISEHPGFQVKVADTVGAGDAFTAALVHEYLRGATLEEMSETANRVGAWVASQVGGMPAPPVSGMEQALALVR